MKWILLLFIFLSATAHADAWDATDKNLALAATAATVIDWGQSRWIAQHEAAIRASDAFHEVNPILGRHPSMRAVNTYFAASLIGGALLSNYLSSQHRKWFLGSVVALELVVIGRNKLIGVGFNF